jgi:hypothetical protein
MFAKLVAIPLRGEDLGCAVDAVLLTPAAELVLIEAAGSSANTTIIALSDSEGERHVGKVKVDAEGRYSQAVLPYKPGASRGTLLFKSKSDKCSSSASVPWGAGRANEYRAGDRLVRNLPQRYGA